jgi:hypothetical protein
MMKRIVIIAVLAGLALAGCGGTSHSSKSASKSASTSTISQSDAIVGTAAGQTLVRQYSTAKYKAEFILAKDFVFWVDGQGKGTFPGAPGPLTPPQRKAAATVVLAYAGQLAAKGQIESDAVSYLKAHGVA